MSRAPLPQGSNMDGRPVWEPPILDYQNLIGEEYEKKREAVLKYFRKDVVKTTAFMDFDTEGEVLQMYAESLWEDFDHAMAEGDNQSRKFFQGLWNEVLWDREEVMSEHLGPDQMVLQRKDDETYRVLKRITNGVWRETTDYMQKVRWDEDDGDEIEQESEPSSDDMEHTSTTMEASAQTEEHVSNVRSAIEMPVAQDLSFSKRGVKRSLESLDAQAEVVSGPMRQRRWFEFWK